MGKAQDNYLAFTARQDVAAGSGALVLCWPNAPGGSAGCSSNTSWPILDAVTVLGIPPVDPTSVTVLVNLSHPAATLYKSVKSRQSLLQMLRKTTNPITDLQTSHRCFRVVFCTCRMLVLHGMRPQHPPQLALLCKLRVVGQPSAHTLHLRRSLASQVGPSSLSSHAGCSNPIQYVGYCNIVILCHYPS